MMYFQTQDAWEAVAVASTQNDGFVPIDPVTQRIVGIEAHGGYYFVPVVESLDLPVVDYETMAQHFEVVNAV